ncbi:MAG: hypothetical protein HXY24_11850, partial [Rubrivivax sp.]|nr:hypothetical protein [Rubrivivax sp.]
MRARSSLAALLGLAACTCAPAAPPLLDPNVAEFPESSLVDFGARRPTRPDGFLTVNDAGQFTWPNGERARFWGINVAAESVFQPFERIDACVARIARAGFDLVRIHHIDGTARGILVGGADSQAFDAAKLEQLDYWIFACGQAGLSVYLDLLDYREFVAGDGVLAAAQLGRGAKPYALFDPRLVALQKQYARALLRDHRNRFTGKAYADDPTVALVELFDENGLFIRRADWPDLAAPYRTRLRQLFTWFTLERDLLGRDGALPAGWPRPEQWRISDPLPPHPWIAEGRLAPPLPFALAPDRPAESERERRQRAGASLCAEFAAWVHRAYYREMRDFLRAELSLRVPLTAIGDGNILPDLQAVADELDFTGTNWYWDHPVFRAGRAWHMPFLFHYRNPLAAADPETFGPKATLAKLHGKPLVVREWNVCFPNPHRAAGTVEAAVYAALQDIDAMILFTYGALPGAPQLSYFDVRSDPTRWGLAGPLGEIFRTRAVAPSRRRIDLAHSRVDTLRFCEYATETRALAYVSRLSNRLYGDRLEADADLTLTSGRSSTGMVAGGPRLLFRNDPIGDLDGTPVLEPASWFGNPVGLVQRGAELLNWDGMLMLPPGLHPRGAGGRFGLSDLRRAGLLPQGEGADSAAGFVDLGQRVIGFGRLGPGEQQRAALDALRLFWGEA